MSAAGICLCFAGIALVPKTVAQASPCLLQAPAFVLQASRSHGKIKRRHLTTFGVLKNLKEGRCRGEGVANATAVRIEGSIVCQTCFQTGVGFSIYSRCSLQSGLALGSCRAKAMSGARHWKNQLQAHAIINNILELSTGCDDHCTVVVVITDSPKRNLINTHFFQILEWKHCEHCGPASRVY